ncbi:unnamed protein product [Acanthoscelides obtectus]|uniref:Uncharacterized protein n=1 Tax=Acanthoscelides obtectus TaxID=200917 RepID=A0A9P0PN84_ACAOB|nr:unnamed protein product [Acanthoscelides obtectus]CAK1652936.1 hypothetical protein AOBTE_LOCUS17977 [Acanthoscelides obtectus]
MPISSKHVLFFKVLVFVVQVSYGQLRRVKHDEPAAPEQHSARHSGMWNGSRVGLRRACDAELEYRLTRLEVQVAEKTDRLVNELKDGNHKLQAIELQEEEIRNAIEGRFYADSVSKRQ